jgi:hypothetical protein
LAGRRYKGIKQATSIVRNSMSRLLWVSVAGIGDPAPAFIIINPTAAVIADAGYSEPI